MLFIDGSWVPARSGRWFESRNPATGKVLGRAADGGAEDARAAVESAAAAFRDWAKITAHQRSALLYEAWRLMTARREELAQLMTAEQGKPLRMARNEVTYAADFLLWFAEEAKRSYGETIPSSRADQRFLVLRQPIGVAAAITPWNYPVSMLTRKIAPAVAAGCTIVLKPAEQTPLCAIETFRILEEAGFPAGRDQPRHHQRPTPGGGRAPDQSRRAQDQFHRVDRGRKGHRPRGPSDQLKRVSLELGGHAPFLVFADADPVHAAKGAALVKFLNTGQACICPNRHLRPSVGGRALPRRVGGAGREAPPGQWSHGRRHCRAADRRPGHGEDAAPGRRRARPRRHRSSPGAPA